jgi:hypothetical protein
MRPTLEVITERSVHLQTFEESESGLVLIRREK